MHLQCQLRKGENSRRVANDGLVGESSVNHIRSWWESHSIHSRTGRSERVSAALNELGGVTVGASGAGGLPAVWRKDHHPPFGHESSVTGEPQPHSNL